MSSYENYESVSKFYDDQREAIGSDVIAGMMQFYCGKPLKEMHVLDAGCGTGNYAAEILQYGCGYVTLLDASPGMLEKAREKMAQQIQSGRVKEVIEAKLPAIPYPDQTFDAVMFNLVLHHLGKDEPDQLNVLTQTLKEARRVIKPNGVLSISTVLPESFKHFWYCHIIPGLNERFAQVMPSIPQLENVFEKSGFNCVHKLNCLGLTLISDYNNYEGLLDDAWRSVCSYWARATEQELEEAKAFIRDLKARGELEAWCKERDSLQTEGHLTLIFCKPK